MKTLQNLAKKIISYYADADLSLLEKACHVSGELGQPADSEKAGQILDHCQQVAFILADLKMDPATIIAGILHHFSEDELLRNEVLRNEFGEEIAGLVESVTRLNKMFFRNNEERQAENFRKMLLAMARDIRVILIKLADRLQDMRTLYLQPVGQQRKIARETLDIYAPLANRLGISWLKSELEDLSLRYIEPEIFSDLQIRVERQKKERETYIEEVKRNIRSKLKQNEIQGDVSGRSKHIFSIYRKMSRQGIGFEQVYDLIAFRIIVPSVKDCYAVLGIVHAAWKPVPGRFKDYIAMPKPNMYQSLHTTVVGPQGQRIEIQIRTEDMHRVAEDGIAAHWKYKEGKSSGDGLSQDDRRFRWLRQVVEWQKELKDSREFMSSLKLDLFPEEVYVFTPRGDVMELPRGATPIDFAYGIHTDVGSRCVGARVNGKLVPLRTELHNGDIIEVLTSQNQTPSKDWLKFVRTSKARNKIRQWVKAEQREKSVALGKDLLDKEFRKYGFSLKKLLTQDQLAPAIEELGFRTAEDILAAVGYGKVSLGQVITRVVPQEKLKAEAPPAPQIGKEPDKGKRRPSSAIKIQGVEDIMFRFAKCCNPVPGDPVVGFITRGRGLTLHTRDCPSVLESDPERRVEVEWDLKRKSSRPAKIRAYCVDQKGILAGITAAITESEANIVSASIHSTEDQQGVNIFQIDVQDLDHLNRVINAIRNVKGVYRVERLRS